MYDNISKDNNSKFPKSPNLARVWEWRGIGTDCPVMLKILTLHILLVLSVGSATSFDPFAPGPFAVQRT